MVVKLEERLRHLQGDNEGLGERVKDLELQLQKSQESALEASFIAEDAVNNNKTLADDFQDTIVELNERVETLELEVQEERKKVTAASESAVSEQSKMTLVKNQNAALKSKFGNLVERYKTALVCD